MKQCEYCGRENPHGAACCHECGTTLVAESERFDSADPGEPLSGEAKFGTAHGAISIVGGLLASLAGSPAGVQHVLEGIVRIASAAEKSGELSAEDHAYALLACGTQLEIKGCVRDAIELYEVIIQNHPDTEASKDAARCIEALKAKLI